MKNLTQEEKKNKKQKENFQRNFSHRTSQHQPLESDKTRAQRVEYKEHYNMRRGNTILRK